ncbi:MAG: hypothetical protein QUS12_09495, partial [Methanosarcina sp.]|nr:hypothetical protein [Methanosarcina sp.]
MDGLSITFNEQDRQRADLQHIIEKEKIRLDQQRLQFSEGEKQAKTLLDTLPILHDELKRNQEEISRLEKKLATRA